MSVEIPKKTASGLVYPRYTRMGSFIAYHLALTMHVRTLKNVLISDHINLIIFTA